MNTQLFNFNGIDIPILVDEHNNPLFIAKDICSVLEIKNVPDAMLKLDDDEKLMSVLPIAGQNRQVNLITESGLYSLIIRSNKPEAKVFKKWITSEVLPSIRKQYSIEEWVDITGYEGFYQVSNLGRVKTLSRTIVNKFNSYKSKEKLKKLTISSDGRYSQVTLCKEKKVKTFQIHKLVAIAFLNHKPNGHFIVIDHINNVQTDNRVENLQIISQRENCSKDKSGYSSMYTGVYYDKSAKSYISRIRVGGEKKYLGCFRTEIEAHLAYQRELQKITKPKPKKTIKIS